jgi:Protein of unknown function (DUF6044)
MKSPNKTANFLSSYKFLIILTFILFFIYFSPYLILGKNAYVLIHDNLNQMNMLGIFDGKMKAEIFPENVDEHFTLPGTEAIFHLAHPKLDKLFYRWDYFWGFVFNEFFYRLIALIGIFILLKRFLFKTKQLALVSLLLSFSFISLPFWPPGNLSVAGLPLFMYAFVNLKNKSKIWLSYLFIILYSFYSNFFFIGVFNSFILLIYVIYLIVKKKINLQIIIGLLLYLFSSIISHYPLFLNEFFYGISTNRAAQEIEGCSLISSIKMMIYDFLWSHKLSHSLHTAVILPSSLIISYLIWKKKDRPIIKLIFPIWIGLIIVPILYGLFYWQPMMNLYNSLNLGFRFDRLYVFVPIIWFSLWSILLLWVTKNYKFGKQITFLLILSQLCINFYFYTFRAYTQHPTFNEFTSSGQFANITKVIGNNSRVGCIGFFPAVANYNGLKTVGSFSSYYPQDFKDQFRKIIAPELQNNEELKQYFENKGSALFLFDDEIGTSYKDQEKIRLINTIECDLNLNELKKLNVKYLLSTVRISNSDIIQLKEMLYQNSEEDYYRIFIYEIM